MPTRPPPGAPRAREEDPDQELYVAVPEPGGRTTYLLCSMSTNPARNPNTKQSSGRAFPGISTQRLPRLPQAVREHPGGWLLGP